ncbi:hypothetical protein BJ912DRAFT_1044914 [Pholiota molesta]|nr:hypothetical protein BJ912DRAFT_1044914 [Pholiota molesta]
MQATCVQRECPKCILSNDESILQNLPAELLVEVFQHLGWEDVFVMRRTCKLFFDISNSWPLWVCLFYRLSSEVRVAPILERPISAYTAKELEYVVMHRISQRYAGQPVPRRVYAPTFFRSWTWIPKRTGRKPRTIELCF